MLVAVGSLRRVSAAVVARVIASRSMLVISALRSLRLNVVANGMARTHRTMTASVR
jgi:hypothetical protein